MANRDIVEIRDLFESLPKLYEKKRIEVARLRGRVERAELFCDNLYAKNWLSYEAKGGTEAKAKQKATIDVFKYRKIAISRKANLEKAEAEAKKIYEDMINLRKDSHLLEQEMSLGIITGDGIGERVNKPKLKKKNPL